MPALRLALGFRLGLLALQLLLSLSPLARDDAAAARLLAKECPALSG